MILFGLGKSKDRERKAVIPKLGDWPVWVVADQRKRGRKKFNKMLFFSVQNVLYCFIPMRIKYFLEMFAIVP